MSERLFNGKTTAKMDYSTIPTVVFSHLLSERLDWRRQAIKELWSRPNQGLQNQALLLCTLLALAAVRNTFQIDNPAGSEEKVVGLHGVAMVLMK